MKTTTYQQIKVSDAVASKQVIYGNIKGWTRPVQIELVEKIEYSGLNGTVGRETEYIFVASGGNKPRPEPTYTVRAGETISLSEDAIVYNLIAEN